MVIDLSLFGIIERGRERERQTDRKRKRESDELQKVFCFPGRHDILSETKICIFQTH